MKLNILIPLAGNRTFKKEEGSAFPKILNEVNGKLLLERAASPMLELPYQKNFLTVVPKSHVKQYNLDINKINLTEFVRYFKSKVKNFKRIDKGMLINLYNDFKKKKIN